MSNTTRTLGIVAIEPKGEYDATAYYEKLNTVTYNDSTYMALRSSTGVLPTDTEYWQLIGGGVKKEDTILTFNTVDDMKSNNDLKEGMVAETLGYHSANDGGAATYKITSEESETDYQEELDNGLYATLIIKNNTISVKQFGAYGDNIHDDTNAFKNAITYINGKFMNLYINSGKYIITEPLYVDWSNSNFWQNFNGSYSIKGAGMYQSILKFTTSNGLHINRNENTLSIDIQDFSITNETYNPLEEENITVLPDDTKGIGLLLKHIGYTGHISRVGIRGFYIGLATRKCYGGPIIDNIFVINTVFGYSSKQDTSLEHNSCNYTGYESCYIQEGSAMTLKNIVCEGNVSSFKTDTYNQRSKFNGRGFSFYSGSRTNLFACYSEQLFGNARYIEDSRIIENNGIINNNMAWLLEQAAYADLKAWVQANNHNYDEVYVNIKTVHYTYCLFNAPNIEHGTASINEQNPSPLMKVDSDGKYYAPNVIFKGVVNRQGAANTFSLLSHGNAKPIVYLMGTYEVYQSNYEKLPRDLYGTVKTKNNISPTNWNGSSSLELSRIGNFSDTTYDEVMLRMRHTLDGAMVFYRVTNLNGTQVDSKEVMRIATDGKVTFAQNQ